MLLYSIDSEESHCVNILLSIPLCSFPITRTSFSSGLGFQSPRVIHSPI